MGPASGAWTPKPGGGGCGKLVFLARWQVVGLKNLVYQVNGGGEDFRWSSLHEDRHLLGRAGGFMWRSDGAVVVGIVGKRLEMSLVALLVFIIWISQMKFWNCCYHLNWYLDASVLLLSDRNQTDWFSLLFLNISERQISNNTHFLAFLFPS